jgi:Fic-DOC domain mobile mystery protein B
VALIGAVLPGETPLTEEDIAGLKLPLIKTREQLSAVEGPNILNGKQWALKSNSSRMPGMLSIDYLQELHRRMLGDVWEWAGKIRTAELGNEFASPFPDIRPHLANLYADATEYWLQDKKMSPDELAVRVHHRVVKIHPFRNGNGRHSRLLADLILEKHFERQPFTWGGNGNLGNDDPSRNVYLAGLRAADKGNYAPLVELCRS